jgi:uncharacterized membrane-anchored protein YhcB (DUF1043 family)
VRRLVLVGGAALIAAVSLALDGAAPVAWIGVSIAFVALGLGEALAARGQAARLDQQAKSQEELAAAVTRLSENVKSLWDSQQSDNGRLWNLENLLIGGTDRVNGAAPAPTRAPDAVALAGHQLAGAAASGDIVDGKMPGIVSMVAGELHEVRVQVDETATELRNRFDLMSDLITALQVSVDDLRLRANAAARDKA